MMTTSNKKYQLRRFIVYLLRHRPQELGLVLQKEGFVPIEELICALRKKPKYDWVTPEIVREIVDSQPDKQRLQIEGDRIRARYGHSEKAIEEMAYPPVEPPAFLYHGTPERNVPSILEHGLSPRKRKYVHLSDNKEVACDVGLRYSDDIVVLVVCCEKAKAAGVRFYHPEENIWLSDPVPPEFIHLDERAIDRS